MPRLRLYLARARKSFGARVALYALVGVAAAVVASLASELLGGLFPFNVSADAIDDLLTIIASSMLAVTTFSVAALSTAYGGATSHGTARATRLLTEDPVVQKSLATFVGSFLFSIVGLVALKVSAYGPEGRAVLFGVSLLMIVRVVVALLRWITQLTSLGSVADTAARIETETRSAMKARLAAPYLGGTPLPAELGPLAPGSQEIRSDKVGYLQHVDAAALARFADEHDLRLDVLVLPGTFLTQGTPLARVHGVDHLEEKVAETVETVVARTYVIGDQRTYEQDPRFGVVVLTEVALRALSPSANDPGTAIDVIGRQIRLLTEWALAWDEADQAEPTYPCLRFPGLAFADLYEDAFSQIGRDGAARVDVMVRLIKSLTSLTQIGPTESQIAARHQLDVAASRAETALSHPEDLRRLRETLAAVR